MAHALFQEDLRGIVYLNQTLLAHFKHAHLVGRAKAVLDAAQQAIGVKAFAFEIEDGIHDVFQHPRPGDGARSWSRGPR